MRAKPFGNARETRTDSRETRERFRAKSGTDEARLRGEGREGNRTNAETNGKRGDEKRTTERRGEKDGA